MDVNERIEEQLKSHDVLAVHEGHTRFSAVRFFGTGRCSALNAMSANRFLTSISFEDQEIREGLKTYSNWPTFPQLYVKG